ncbi:hypothetical protein SAMN05443665_101439 [Actinomadura meyerae]|uniref:Uncharacterized protein n=1 Tax=Actinomadura meyerae TaxID=240840 RepID=A0A239J6U5_9ACTN|nr:hypothetical protein [Actinomadura meyerae]SNT01392.1 hypothetical protein SAMN05443665_101439 [Actinomadura meyerae]
MRKGIHIGPGMVRLTVALLALSLAVVVVKEIPAMRRYIKSESM